MTRPPIADIWMATALHLAQRSTCERRHVGCVITNAGGEAVLGVGYNGNAKGMPNACDDPHAPGACGCLHAEINALLKAPGLEPGKVAYVTTAPCVMCAKAMVNARVARVVYLDGYRDQLGLQLLAAAGIDVERYAGATLDT